MSTFIHPQSDPAPREPWTGFSEYHELYKPDIVNMSKLLNCLDPY